jgi:hypothetical protein
MYKGYFQQLAERRLPDGTLAPGRQVRGWIAYKVPFDARSAYVQFQPGYLEKTVDFTLE